jgi:hypothetical protein
VNRRMTRWRGGIVVLALVLGACSRMASPTTTARQVRPTVPYTMPTSTTTPVNYAAHLTVSSTMLTVGEQISISGTGCPIGSTARPDLGQTLNGVHFLPLDAGAVKQVPTAPVVNDSWTVSLAVPMLEEGPALVGAFCEITTGGSTVTRFTYPSVPVTVVLGAHLAVLPSASINAGTTLTVNPANKGCDPGAPYVSFDDPTGASQGVPGHPTIGRDGYLQFPVTIVVPPTTRPGTYLIRGSCSVDGHTYSGLYEPLVIMVR